MTIQAIDAGAVGAAAETGSPSRLDPDKQAQSVFSEVLRAAGWAGYVSAPALTSSEPIETQVQNAWLDWARSERTGRYATLQSTERLEQGFGEVLLRAHDEGGYADPIGFLARLSQEELQTVQAVHWLAEPIQVGALTEEGALNLLLPPVAQVDLNHDGLTQSGAAYGLRFPNSNTPPETVAAWDEAIDGMDLRERMTYELQMMLPLLTANIVTDAQGRFVHRYEPGDAGYTNPMASPDYSYRQAASDRLSALEFMLQKGLISREKHDQQSAFWTKLSDALESHGAR